MAFRSKPSKFVLCSSCGLQKIRNSINGASDLICMGCKRESRARINSPSKISYINNENDKMYDPLLDDDEDDYISTQQVLNVGAFIGSTYDSQLSDSYKTLTDELTTMHLNSLIKKTINVDLNNFLNVKWATPLSIQRLYELTSYYGLDNPDCLIEGKGGLAIWTNNRLLNGWVKIELRDVPRIHFDPAPHVDILYVTAKLFVPEDKKLGIKFISQTITYDELAHEITAGCHFSK